MSACCFDLGVSKMKLLHLSLSLWGLYTVHVILKLFVGLDYNFSDERDSYVYSNVFSVVNYNYCIVYIVQ